jgi:hypothetical protein
MARGLIEFGRLLVQARLPRAEIEACVVATVNKGLRDPSKTISRIDQAYLHLPLNSYGTVDSVTHSADRTRIIVVLRGLTIEPCDANLEQ